MIISPAIVIAHANIDTDQIIPARFLLSITKSGFGQHLFADVAKDPDFTFDSTRDRGKSILVAGHNFGSGSSREHAAWALSQAGIQVVVSSLFSDIFTSNAYKNGILPLTLSVEELASLMHMLEKNKDAKLTVDIEKQTISLEDFSATFPIDPFRKRCLLAGQDDMAYLLSHKDAITTYERE